MISKSKNNINSVFVLGSSSEIAKEICIELAHKGCKRFHLLARDLDKNKELINILKAKKINNISEENFDLLNDLQVKKDIQQYDLYLITAGFLGDSNLATKNFSELNRITQTNYSGLLKWLIAIVTPERLDSRSRLWVFSSIAGDLGKPSNYQYGAAKAALSCFCEGLFYKAYKKPFSVRLFKAGYIRTRMSINKAPSILYLDPKKLAKIILKNPNKRGIEYLPWWWFFIMKIIKFLPSSIIFKL
tara:strand:+ start:6006 stop:6740 length:735 start_codon:yes stop_codon:yes gene_type:complete